MRTNNDEEIEIDLLDFFYELIKHWGVILLSMILCALIGLSVSVFLITPKYESTSKLYVLSKSTSITSLTDIQMGTSLTNDYIVVVVGRPVMEQVIKNLDLQEDYKQLTDMVRINNPSNSRILEITVTDTDPDRAKLIADELASVSAAYISDKMDQEPPSIIQSGYADNESVAPKKMRNTAIGALIGLLITIVLIFIAFTLNDTIVTAEDVEKKLGLNLLGSLPLEKSMEYDGNPISRHRKGGAD